MFYLHTTICACLVANSLFVVYSENPVNSIILLILTFLVGICCMLFFNSDFFGVIFMIIYVGAIAILFLFVIMMLDLKDFEEDENYSKEETITLLFGFILLKFLWLTFLKMGSDPLYIFDHYFDDPTGIDLIGQSLYNFLLPYFLIIGLILLVALIGCIVLTLKLDKVNKEKSAQQNNHLQYKNSQYGFRQLSRTDNFLSHFNS